MKEEYDVVVVGAGPGGSIAARTAAEDCDVLLIEKRQEIGSPVRCAEGVDIRLVAKYIVLIRSGSQARLKESNLTLPTVLSTSWFSKKLTDIGKLVPDNTRPAVFLTIRHLLFIAAQPAKRVPLIPLTIHHICIA